MSPDFRARRIVAAVSLALVAGSLHLSATATPAAATPIAATRVAVAPLETSDETAAVVRARTTGKAVLIASRTTATTEYRALPSGLIEATIAGGPVRMRDANGAWTPVDISLVRQADGSVVSKAHPDGLRLSGPAGQGDHDLVVLDGRSVLGWSGPLPAPSIAGTIATYREVKAGVDLVVEATRTGYEQRLIVKNRQAAGQLEQTAVQASDPKTAYPFTVAVSQSSGANFDAFVQTSYSTDQSAATELKIGTNDSGANKARSYLRFDNQEWLWDKQIQAATLNLWEHHSYSCTAKGWAAFRVADVTNTARWTNRPTQYEQVGTSTQTKGWSSACGAGWVTIPVTAAFQYTAAHQLTRTNLGISAASETDNYGWKRFASREAAANPPTVTITYRTATSVDAQATAPETACVTGADRPEITSLNPQLRAQVSNVLGAQVYGTFEWKVVGATTSTTATEGPGASGSWLGTTIPDDAFTEGSSYAWRAQGTDGTTPGEWSNWCEFTVHAF